MRIFTPLDELQDTRIGDRILFKPAYWFDDPSQYSFSATVNTVTGTVVYINEEHHYLRCEYTNPAGCIGHECFKF